MFGASIEEWPELYAWKLNAIDAKVEVFELFDDWELLGKNCINKILFSWWMSWKELKKEMEVLLQIFYTWCDYWLYRCYHE